MTAPTKNIAAIPTLTIFPQNTSKNVIFCPPSLFHFILKIYALLNASTALRDVPTKIPVTSCPQPERLRRQLIDQHTCYHTISDTEDDRPHPKHKRRHIHPHHAIANKIRPRHHHPVRPALNLCPRVIWLQEIIYRQIMYRKEHTDTQNRNNQHHIIQRFLRPARQV